MRFAPAKPQPALEPILRLPAMPSREELHEKASSSPLFTAIRGIFYGTGVRDASGRGFKLYSRILGHGNRLNVLPNLGT